MARLEFFVLCQSTSIDQSTNRLSIFNVVETLRTPRLPLLIPYLVAVSVWLIEAEERGTDEQVILAISNPGGTELHRLTANFVAGSPRQRVVMNLEGLRFDAPGDWKFSLLLNAAPAATHTISVALDEAAEADVIQVSVPAVPSSGS